MRKNEGHTDESKSKISKTLSGRKLSKYTKNRMKESAKIRWQRYRNDK